MPRQEDVRFGQESPVIADRIGEAGNNECIAGPALAPSRQTWVQAAIHVVEREERRQDRVVPLGWRAPTDLGDDVVAGFEVLNPLVEQLDREKRRSIRSEQGFETQLLVQTERR